MSSQGRGASAGRHAGGRGASSGGRSSSSSSAAPGNKRTQENGNQGNKMSEQASGVTEAGAAAAAAAAPKPAGGGWGKGPSFASILSSKTPPPAAAIDAQAAAKDASDAAKTALASNGPAKDPSVEAAAAAARAASELTFGSFGTPAPAAEDKPAAAPAAPVAKPVTTAPPASAPKTFSAADAARAAASKPFADKARQAPRIADQAGRSAATAALTKPPSAGTTQPAPPPPAAPAPVPAAPAPPAQVVAAAEAPTAAPLPAGTAPPPPPAAPLAIPQAVPAQPAVVPVPHVPVPAVPVPAAPVNIPPTQGSHPRNDPSKGHQGHHQPGYNGPAQTGRVNMPQQAQGDYHPRNTHYNNRQPHQGHQGHHAQPHPGMQMGYAQANAYPIMPGQGYMIPGNPQAMMQMHMPYGSPQAGGMMGPGGMHAMHPNMIQPTHVQQGGWQQPGMPQQAHVNQAPAQPPPPPPPPTQQQQAQHGHGAAHGMAQQHQGQGHAPQAHPPPPAGGHAGIPQPVPQQASAAGSPGPGAPPAAAPPPQVKKVLKIVNPTSKEEVVVSAAEAKAAADAAKATADAAKAAAPAAAAAATPAAAPVQPPPPAPKTDAPPAAAKPAVTAPLVVKPQGNAAREIKAPSPEALAKAHKTPAVAPAAAAAAAPAAEPVAASEPAAAPAPSQPADVVTPAPAAEAQPAAASPPTAPVTPAAVESKPAVETAAPAAPAPAAPASGEAASASEPAAADSGSASAGGADSAQADLGTKKKHSIKDVGKRGDARDDQLRDMSDPFAKPKPAEPAAPAPPPPTKPPASTSAAGAAPSQDAPKEDVSDNWESAAEEEGKSAPGSGGGAAPAGASAAAAAGNGRKQYTLDFMKSLGAHFNTRPPGLLPGSGLDQATRNEIVLDTHRPFDNSVMTFDAATFNGGRRGGGGGGMGGGGPSGRQQGGEEWGNRRGGPGPYGPGDRGMGGGGRGMGRDGPRMERTRSQQADDKWERRGPPPPPSPGGRRDGMSRGPSGNLHRTENRFVAGQLQSVDPEEEKRQKQFQGILNKITPDNFERLTHKIVEDIGISEQRTLEGLIDKIFDKALTDTHFSELYSRMCRELSQHPKCPKFDNPEYGGKPIDLRRLLLYKCQEEFEKGVKAMQSVAEREAKEAADGTTVSAGGAKPSEGGAAADEKPAGEGAEEGELPAAAPVELTAEEQKLAERRAAEVDRAARRRMLGNIQFIGYLYKMGLITERILHSCVATLLKEQENPRPEDVECLCKLMTTVGGQLDSTTKQEHKQAMQIYFDRLQKLRDNKKLESRIKFMCQDVLDLRNARWIPRTKKEGPKKIEDIHKEATQELLAQQQRDREESMRGGRDRRGPPPAPSQRNNYDRLLSRDEVPSRTIQMQRAPSSELSFRPAGGGFGRQRNPSPSPAAAAAAAAVAGGRPPVPPPATPFAAAATMSEPPSRQASAPVPPPSLPTMSKKDARTATNAAVEEFAQLYAQQEAQLPAAVAHMLDMFKELRGKGADMGWVFHQTLIAAFEQRGVDFAQRLPPFVQLFKAALGKTPQEGGVTAAELASGAGSILRELHLFMDDQPKAPKSLGPFLAEFIADGSLSLSSVLGEVLAVPPNVEDDPDAVDPPLVDAGGATDLMLTMMTKLKEVKGAEEAGKLWTDSGLDALKFFDQFARENTDRCKDTCSQADLAFLMP